LLELQKVCLTEQLGALPGTLIAHIYSEVEIPKQELDVMVRERKAPRNLIAERLLSYVMELSNPLFYLLLS